MAHTNNGNCPKCLEIFSKYPKFHAGIKAWFFALQKKHPDAHISCAGRGKIDQEVAFQRGASKAHYGQSSHNYNAAIDIFQLKDNAAVWDKTWFNDTVAKELIPELKWYGAPGAKFYELPHVELSNWRDFIGSGLKLVE